MRRRKESKIVGRADKKLFILACILTFLGLMAVTDASGPLALRNFSDKFYYVKQQIVGVFIGLTLMLIFSRINYRFWERVAVPLFFLGIFCLVLVFIPGLGLKVLGASRWVKIGFLSFQPSEIVKFAMVIYLARVFSSGKKIASYLVPVVLVSILIMMQPDLGTTTIIVGFSLAQVFASGVSIIHLVIIGFAGFAMTIILILTSGYRKERLMTFLKETQNPLDEGYHIRQILIALGSGGFWGVGLGQSRQKYLFLPETATDSIFAVIAEEVGFLGSTVLILLFVFFVVRGILVAKRAPDKFSYLLATGISCWIGIQAFLNIASMVALVPLTGIPLPFFSFGSTALVMVLAATGILLNISKYAKK